MCFIRTSPCDWWSNRHKNYILSCSLNLLFGFMFKLDWKLSVRNMKYDSKTNLNHDLWQTMILNNSNETQTEVVWRITGKCRCWARGKISAETDTNNHWTIESSANHWVTRHQQHSHHQIFPTIHDIPQFYLCHHDKHWLRHHSMVKDCCQAPAQGARCIIYMDDGHKTFGQNCLSQNLTPNEA